MSYYDAYADKYQKINGFKIFVKASNNREYEGYLSLKPSTRSTYDIAMRDATIDGLITMDEIDKLIDSINKEVLFSLVKRITAQNSSSSNKFIKKY